MDGFFAPRENGDLCSVYRATHKGTGRRRIIDETNSDMQFLRYGRIAPDGAPIAFNTGEEEMALFCVGGSGTIAAGGETYALGLYDALYVPRETAVEVASAGGFDVCEVAAPATKSYPVALVRFADIQGNPDLSKKAGFPPYARTLNILIGENVPAARVMCGVTFSEDGNWTSWPPHEHAVEKEEIYLYVEMPEPQFGLHLNYVNFHDMAMTTPVRTGDAVSIKNGYHTNVAAPGTKIAFVWMMAAVREEADRVFSVVHVQPEFDGKFKLF